MPYHHDGLGHEVWVKPGGHLLIAEAGTGDPACACGEFKPVPPEATTQFGAVSLINKHVREKTDGRTEDWRSSRSPEGSSTSAEGDGPEVYGLFELGESTTRKGEN